MSPLSNYPPGVTGQEYEVGGATSEWDDEDEICPFCDFEGPMHHEAHHQFGVWAWCSQPDCEGAKTGFDANKEPEPYCYDYMDEEDSAVFGGKD
jgi:hypothetical protein